MMKRRFFIYSISLWFYGIAPAQVFRYEYDLGSAGSGYDSGEGGAGYKSSDNSLYLTGITDISGDDDPLLIKINSDGTKNFVIQYRIASASQSIRYGRLTADGGYLLYGNMDITTADILLIKTNSSGAISWARRVSISGATYLSPSRFYELSGGAGYVLTGSAGVGAGSGDAYVIKISSDGNSISFAKAYGTSRTEHSEAIIEHSSGKIAFVGYRNMGVSLPFDGWWVQLSSDGSLENSRTLGGSNNDYFTDLVETNSNTYMVVGKWCSTGGSCTGYPCSGFLLGVNTSGSSSLRRVFYTSSPSGLVFHPSCIYKTSDNNYWIGGQIDMGGPNVNCLMIKTGSSPSPSTGFSIGDGYEEGFFYSAGASIGNDDFVMGGTKNYAPTPESRSLIVKTNSSVQCDASSVTFSTCNWTLTDLTTLSTTVTNLTITTHTLNPGTDIVAQNRTSTTTQYQDCFVPVKLLSFSGKPENNSVKLFWTTASEENNDFFTIEKSKDGYNFFKIGTIKGAGNSSTIRNYELTDETPQSINYYKLSQTDFDGTTQELGILSVKMSSDESDLSVSVQSNPVSNGVLSLNLYSPKDDNVFVQIIDLHGRIIAEENITIEKKETKLLKITLNKVSDGICFLKVMSKSQAINTKILVMNGSR